MDETSGKTLKELAAEYLGQKPEELLNFALYPGGVTLIGKDGRKVRLHWEVLKGWKVDEVIEPRRKTGDGGPMTGDGSPMTEDRAKQTGDGGQTAGDSKRKAGGKR